jgi:signal transduction histidine kinase
VDLFGPHCLILTLLLFWSGGLKVAVTNLTRTCDLDHTVSPVDKAALLPFSYRPVRLELKSLPLYSRGVLRSRAPGRSPTPALILGLIITLAAVVVYSAYITRQISSLRRLQNDLVDRNRKDSLQLLRIQNDLNLLGLAMRDMLANDEPYPLTAWSAQFQRIREDLNDALRLEAQVAVAARTPEQRAYLGSSVAQFWNAVDRTFALAQEGKAAEARAQIQGTLQARQAALSTAVARLLVQNNSSEEQAAQQIAQIYDRVQGQVYLFFTATLIAILLTSLYLIRSNRRLFAQLASLSEQRSELAQTLISTQESTLRYISRELHDEFGQILTAMGSMLGRAGKHAPEGTPLRAELEEVRQIAQGTLDKVRSLSQALHPVMLDEAGLESTLDWYLPVVERQSGIGISYEKSGKAFAVDGDTPIHVYRVLQEALNNVARHSGARQAWVRLRFLRDALELEVEDHGKGFVAQSAKQGIGLVAMRERAELLGGTLEFTSPVSGGTLVRLRIPKAKSEAHAQ